jgi:hypothetical protein
MTTYAVLATHQWTFTALHKSRVVFVGSAAVPDRLRPKRLRKGFVLRYEGARLG